MSVLFFFGSNSSMKKAIIQICKKLHDRGYIKSYSGNVSVLDSTGNIVITPTRKPKESLAVKDLAKIDLKGNVLSRSKPSSEYRIHCKIYQNRKDVKAIVHAHPKYSVVCSLAAISFEQPILPETALYLGAIPTVPYAPPGSAELADAITKYIKDHNAIIMERHGIICIGNDLSEAYARIEEVEHAAEISYLLSLKGRLPVLGRSQIVKLLGYVEDQKLPIPNFAKTILHKILAK